MTDDTSQNKPRRRRPADAAATPRPRRSAADEPAAAAPAADDPDAALQRLESMGGSGRGRPASPPASSASVPAATAPTASSRPMTSATKAPRSRPRPAATSGSTRIVLRIAAPVVFLVAIIALVSIAMQSGIVGGATDVSPTPTPKVTKTKGGQSTSAGTKKYAVKSGDSLSAIAARFGTSVSEIQALNPELSASTLVVGEKILVPIP